MRKGAERERERDEKGGWEVAKAERERENAGENQKKLAGGYQVLFIGG